MERRVTPPKRVTSPTWPPPPPCKQALNRPLEFHSIHNTLQSTTFTDLQCQLVNFCICAEFLDTKLSENQILKHPKVSRLKHEFQATYVIMKLYIYENHIWELRGEELYERRSSQLWRQLLQLRKESLKKIQACTGFETLTSAIPVQQSTNWANKPTGRRALNWIVLNPWKDRRSHIWFCPGIHLKLHHHPFTGLIRSNSTTCSQLAC